MLKVNGESVSIVENPWQFACQWYGVDEIHYAINRERELKSPGDLPVVPSDVSSREFAEWLADQYRHAMRKGAELAINEMRSKIDIKAEAERMGIKPHSAIDGLIGQ